MCRAIAAGVMFAALGAAACSSRASAARTKDSMAVKTARVEGDVYLVMVSGDTKKGAGRTIYLIRDSDSLQARIGRVCERVLPALNATAATLSAIQDSIHRFEFMGPDMEELMMRHARSVMAKQTAFQASVKDSIDRALALSLADTTGTGLAAHYTFPRVPFGRYLLVASWQIGDNDYRWVAPIEVSSSQTLRRDLDNNVESGRKLYCGLK